ncbi:MAG: hypothetical protein ACI8YQ_002691 [Polaribacter sp.]|jgi:hypothetical protein
MKAMFPMLFCLLFLFACQNDTTTDKQGTTDTFPAADKSKEEPSNIDAAAIDYDALSTAYCKCAEHTVSINEKLKALSKDSDSAAFDAMLPEADKAFKDAMECCRDAKFQQTTEEVDQKKLFEPLKKRCPDLPSQLILKMVTEIK